MRVSCRGRGADVNSIGLGQLGWAAAGSLRAVQGPIRYHVQMYENEALGKSFIGLGDVDLQ